MIWLLSDLPVCIPYNFVFFFVTQKVIFKPDDLVRYLPFLSHVQLKTLTNAVLSVEIHVGQCENTYDNGIVSRDTCNAM